MAQHRPLLVHVTNIPTPYRIVFANTLQDELAAKGYGLHVLYAAKSDPNRHWTIPFSEIAYPYEVMSGISVRLGAFRTQVNPGIMGRLRELRPAIVLVAGSWNMPAAMVASGQSALSSALSVFWSEGHAEAVLHPTGPIAWLRRRCLSVYDAFAVPNQSSADFLRHDLGRSPVILPLPNTVDDDFFRSVRSNDKAQVRQQLGIPLHANVFVSVSRLDDVKGVRELVAAMSVLPTEAGRCVLVLAGEGPLRQDLQAVIDASGVDVRLVGQQDASGVRNYLAAADAFVLATKRDPNPLAVIEAAFAGVPLIVSSKAGNVRELVKDGLSGMVIPTVDSTVISALLARFCQLSESERKEMGNYAARLADTDFQRREVARRFVAALLTLRTMP